jgi:hypothetical protein
VPLMTTVKDTAAIAAKRREFVAAAARLAELRAQYDMLMNGFKFDEARALQGLIEAAEQEHRHLAAALPPPAPETEPAPYRVAGRRRRQ